jgi:hypothetical protein
LIQEVLKVSNKEFFYDNTFDDYLKIGSYYYKNNAFNSITTLFECLAVLNSNRINEFNEKFNHYDGAKLLNLIPSLTSLYEFSNCEITIAHSPLLTKTNIDKFGQFTTVNCPMDNYDIAVRKMVDLKKRLFKFQGIFHLYSVQFSEELLYGEVILKMRIRGYEDVK